MYPDIGVAESCHDECRNRLEQEGGHPEDQEPVNIHGIWSPREYALANQRNVAVGRIEMIDAESPCEPEISANAIDEIDARRKQDQGNRITEPRFDA